MGLGVAGLAVLGLTGFLSFYNYFATEENAMLITLEALLDFHWVLSQ